ncbi:MAG: response regulator [Pseudomonadota bacterium]
MVHILCLDNDENLLRLLHSFLKSQGYQVMVGKDGREGLEQFSNGYDFNLVITDINMPIVDGTMVAKHIRNSEKANIPIVAITGSYESLIERELFDHVLIKPFKLETLFDVVKSYVG